MKKIKELIQSGYEVSFTNNGGDVHLRLIKVKTRSHWTHTIPAREFDYSAEQVLSDGIEEIAKAERAAAEAAAKKEATRGLF